MNRPDGDDYNYSFSASPTLKGTSENANEKAPKTLKSGSHAADSSVAFRTLKGGRGIAESAEASPTLRGGNGVADVYSAPKTLKGAENNADVTRAPHEFRERAQYILSALGQLINIRVGDILCTLDSDAARNAIFGGEALLLPCTAYWVPHMLKAYYADSTEMGTLEMRNRSIIRLTQLNDMKDFLVPILSGAIVTDQGNPICYCEVIPCFSQGDIARSGAGRQRSFTEMQAIISQLNEGLNRIHKHNYLHMDIKPANIYEQGSRILIGDFGVMKECSNDRGAVYDPRQKETANHTLRTLVKEAAGTSGYMAPELAIAIIQGSNVTVGPDIDYYSLGPTLASIWLGRDIWEGISDLANCQRQSRLPFPRNTETEIRMGHLLDGLFQYQSEDRWGYGDVAAWLKNPDYDRRRASYSEPSMSKRADVCLFMGKELSLEEGKGVFETFTRYWDQAKKLLYSGLEDSVTYDMTLKQRIVDIVETEFPSNMDKGLSVLLADVYPQGGIAWKGKMWQTPSACGHDLARCLQTGDTDAFRIASELVCYDVAGYWMRSAAKANPDNDRVTQFAKIVTEISCLAQQKNNVNQLDYNLPELTKGYSVPCKIAAYWLVFLLSGNPLQLFGREISDLTDFVSLILGENGRLYRILKDIFNTTEGTQILGFLCSQGGNEHIQVFLNEFESASNDEPEVYSQKAETFLIMLERMSVGLYESRNDLVNFIREYHCKFGPQGYLYWWSKKVQEGDYYAEKKDAEMLFREVDSVGISPSDDLEKQRTLLNQLESLYISFLGKVQNNYYLVRTGSLKGKTIIPKDTESFAWASLPWTSLSVPNGYITECLKEGIE